MLVNYGITVEISCVLTDRSITGLYDFAVYLMQYGGKVMLYPYPIRGNLGGGYFPHQLAALRRLIGDYGVLASVLPPLPYLEHMLIFLEKKRKDFRCCVPFFTLGSFQDGLISTCPLGWQSLGNMHTDNPRDLVNGVGKGGIYNVMTARKPLIKYCMGCFSSYDIFSLYMRGDVSLQDFCRVPIFNHPTVLARIEEIKDAKKKIISCHNASDT